MIKKYCVKKIKSTRFTISPSQVGDPEMIDNPMLRYLINMVQGHSVLAFSVASFELR